MTFSRILVLATFFLAAPCIADIAKTAIPSENGLQLYWWPNVEVPDGWFHDRETSISQFANFIVPIGETFAEAEVVLYARAIYKESPGASPTLDAMIQSDISRFEALPSRVDAEKVSALPMSDQSLTISYAFYPENEGNWEQVSYVDDGDFFTIFVISSSTHSGYLSALTAYEEMIRSYTREP